VDRHEAHQRLAGAGDDDFLAGKHPVDQMRKLGLGIVYIGYVHKLSD
jgi:hypothetical protein